ncbi:hypothetical protein G5A68_13045, partial [Dorea formicigenerans]|nr:hypothetical protein [Dorea formicigenerans]
MNSYAILRMEKRKIGDVGRICNHHERLKETYKSNVLLNWNGRMKQMKNYEW